MYAVWYGNRWEVFDSYLEAEEFIQGLYSTYKIDSMDELEIVPYHWTMG